MIKAIVFDWFGVVTPHSKLDSLDELIRLTGLPKDTLRPFFIDQAELLKTGRIRSDEFLKNLNQTFGLTISPAELETIWANETESMPDALFLQTLKKVKSKGLKTIILSNTFPHTEEMIKKKGWYDYFDAVYLSSSTGHAKPHASFFELMSGAMNLHPQEVLFIDDQEKNTQSASKIGFNVLILKNEERQQLYDLILRFIV